MSVMSVRIPYRLAKSLHHVAQETERPRSFIIQKAIEAYLQEYADLQIALDRLRDTADLPISSAELKKSLAL